MNVCNYELYNLYNYELCNYELCNLCNYKLQFMSVKPEEVQLKV